MGVAAWARRRGRRSVAAFFLPPPVRDPMPTTPVAPAAPAAARDPLVEPAPAGGRSTPRLTSRLPARLEFIDRLRGLVIVLMVLDHVREYWAADALLFEATDLARTTAALYATRWVTHLCAPTFVLLAGVAAYLQRAAASDPAAASRVLARRGLWLIALELTVIGFGFDFAAPFFFFQVIWAIGLGLVLVAGLARVGPTAVLALGVVVVAGHGVLGAVRPTDVGALAPLWQLLMTPGPAPAPLPGLVVYPAVPWFGILCLGYGLGPLFTRADRERRRTLGWIAAGALALFVVLRAANGYGDPAPWTRQSTGVLTTLSFLKVSKYPPSLLFVLVTLGISLPLGLALERMRGAVGGALGRGLLVFGRTPLFTYLVHVYLIHGLALAVGVAMGVPASAFTSYLSDPSRLRDAGWGVGLPAVYAIWVAVVAALYPAARWYAALKERRRAWWVHYL